MKIKMQQVSVSCCMTESGDYSKSIVGVSDSGIVYYYDNESRGWVALRMLKIDPV